MKKDCDPKMLRCFIGIFFAEDFLFEIEKCIQPLMQHFDPQVIRWQKKEQIHLTLRFLGITPVTIVPHIEAALTQVALHQKSFSLSLKNMCYFPNKKRPQVLAIDVDGSLPLKNLVADIEKEMSQLGFLPEKRTFKGHITLGRFKSRKLADLPVLTDFNIQVKIPEFFLVQSQTLPQGSRYSTLLKFALQH